MSEDLRQYSTFFIAERMYGIDVMRVQEVTRALPMSRVPLAPSFVHGLINLRGQISTAIGLRELFEIDSPVPMEQMNVVCRIQDILISFLVDKIGDVMELSSKDFEEAPETIPESTRRFIDGVYKTQHHLMSVINVDKISDFFTKVVQKTSPERKQ